MNRVAVVSLCLLCAIGLVSAGCTGTVTSNPPPVAPSITTQPMNQTVTAGQTATFMVVATGTAPLSYQWQKNGTAISGATSASYTTPATTSADNGALFRVMISNSVGSVTSNTATLTVNPTPVFQITTTSLPAGRIQAAYSATLQATGGTPPYTWSQPSGQLPPGLTLAPSSGIISGTPTTAGQFTSTIQVQDTVAQTASANLTITINTAAVSAFGHIIIVVEENTNYSSVIGTTAMPYLNGLISQYGLATQ